ncbi:MAG: spore coat associated protein CotJA [Eubacteriales bacterium]|nr:spore coat associated protein CotJA [Eubacteriales bacterium]
MNPQLYETNSAPCRSDTLSGMSLAMAYVPWQPAFSNTFDLCTSLRAGTIFPDLCKPFCGKRGGCS